MATCRVAQYPMHTELSIQNTGNDTLCGMLFYAITLLRYRSDFRVRILDSESGFGLATDHSTVKVLHCKFHKPRLQPLQMFTMFPVSINHTLAQQLHHPHRPRKTQSAST